MIPWVQSIQHTRNYYVQYLVPGTQYKVRSTRTLPASKRKKSRTLVFGNFVLPDDYQARTKSKYCSFLSARRLLTQNLLLTNQLQL